jgi:hypothetical protein
MLWVEGQESSTFLLVKISVPVIEALAAPCFPAWKKNKKKLIFKKFFDLFEFQFQFIYSALLKSKIILYIINQFSHKFLIKSFWTLYKVKIIFEKFFIFSFKWFFLALYFFFFFFFRIKCLLKRKFFITLAQEISRTLQGFPFNMA